MIKYVGSQYIIAPAGVHILCIALSQTAFIMTRIHLFNNIKASVLFLRSISIFITNSVVTFFIDSGVGLALSMVCFSPVLNSGSKFIIKQMNHLCG